MTISADDKVKAAQVCVETGYVHGAINLLVEVLREGNDAKRGLARAALVAGSPELRAAFLDACRDDEALTAEHGDLLVAWHGSQGCVLLVHSLGSRFRHVREAARRAVARVVEAGGSAALLPALCTLLRLATDVETRETALGALAGVPEPAALQELDHHLLLPEWRLRRVAATGLGQRRELRALSLLAGVLNDPHPLVRDAVHRALDAFGGEGDEAVIDGLLNLAAANDQPSATCAANVLARMAAGKAGATIVRLLAARQQGCDVAERSAWNAVRVDLMCAPLRNFSDYTGRRTKAKFEYLIAKNALSERELEAAIRAAVRGNVDIEDVLRDEYQVTASGMGAALAEFFGVPYEPFEPDRVVPQDLLKNLTRNFLEATGWVPVGGGTEAVVALCTEPEHVRQWGIAARQFPNAKIIYRVTTCREFAATLDQFFGRPIDDESIGAYLDRDDRIDDVAQDPTNIPAPITDQVYFTVTAPKTILAASPFVLNVSAHLEGDRIAVLERAAEEAAGVGVRSRTKGPTAIGRGRRLGIRVQVTDFGFDDEDMLVWSGAAGNATFGIAVPEGVVAGIHLGTATFAVEGVPISRLHFELEVGSAEGPRGERTLREQRTQTAFASYASEDLREVLARIQGMQKLLPDLDVFLDIVSIRSGEKWAKRLEEEIERRDTFYLFWSAAASRSEWVEREWRAALRLKGLDSIEPVPLESPRNAPPPAELGALHFNEWTLAYRGFA